MSERQNIEWKQDGNAKDTPLGGRPLHSWFCGPSQDSDSGPCFGQIARHFT